MKKVKEFFIDYVVSSLIIAFFKLSKGEIRQNGNLPKGPCIMAFNHVSYLDWLIVHEIFRKKMNKEIIFIGKKKLFEHWLFKHIMEFGNVICVDQEKVSKKLLTSVNETLKKGNILGIFPEGKRSDDGRLIRAHPGITRLILINKVPVVPVGLNGFYDILPKGKRIPRIKKLNIAIGEAIYLDKYYGKKLGKEDIENITRMIMRRIGELTNQQYDF